MKMKKKLNSINEMEELLSYDKAENEGAKAFYDDKTIKDNPYDKELDAYPKGSFAWTVARNTSVRWRIGFHAEENKATIDEQAKEIEKLEEERDELRFFLLKIKNDCGEMLLNNPFFRREWREFLKGLRMGIRSKLKLKFNPESFAKEWNNMKKEIKG